MNAKPAAISRCHCHHDACQFRPYGDGDERLGQQRERRSGGRAASAPGAAGRCGRTRCTRRRTGSAAADGDEHERPCASLGVDGAVERTDGGDRHAPRTPRRRRRRATTRRPPTAGSSPRLDRLHSNADAAAKIDATNSPTRRRDHEAVVGVGEHLRRRQRVQEQEAGGAEERQRHEHEAGVAVHPGRSLHAEGEHAGCRRRPRPRATGARRGAPTARRRRAARPAATARATAAPGAAPRSRPGHPTAARRRAAAFRSRAALSRARAAAGPG